MLNSICGVKKCAANTSSQNQNHLYKKTNQRTKQTNSFFCLRKLEEEKKCFGRCFVISKTRNVVVMKQLRNRQTDRVRDKEMKTGGFG